MKLWETNLVFLPLPPNTIALSDDEDWWREVVVTNLDLELALSLAHVHHACVQLVVVICWSLKVVNTHVTATTTNKTLMPVNLFRALNSCRCIYSKFCLNVPDRVAIAFLPVSRTVHSPRPDSEYLASVMVWGMAHDCHFHITALPSSMRITWVVKPRSLTSTRMSFLLWTSNVSGVVFTPALQSVHNVQNDSATHIFSRTLS